MNIEQNTFRSTRWSFKQFSPNIGIDNSTLQVKHRSTNRIICTYCSSESQAEVYIVWVHPQSTTRTDHRPPRSRLGSLGPRVKHREEINVNSCTHNNDNTPEQNVEQHAGPGVQKITQFNYHTPQPFIGTGRTATIHTGHISETDLHAFFIVERYHENNYKQPRAAAVRRATLLAPEHIPHVHIPIYDLLPFFSSMRKTFHIVFSEEAQIRTNGNRTLKPLFDKNRVPWNIYYPLQYLNEAQMLFQRFFFI